MSIIKTIIGLIVIGVVTGFVIIWFGMFNVAATDRHWKSTKNFLYLVRDRSVAVRSADIKVPDNLNDNARIKRGAANYDAMCAQCHLAPGIETSELHVGLMPKPPRMYLNPDFPGDPRKTFWIIKNGVKMTGMPAWGINNSDEQIWDMIATIKAMNTMSPERYQELVASGTHTHKGDGHGGGDHHGSNTMNNKNDHHGKPAGQKKKSGHYDDGHTH